MWSDVVEAETIRVPAVSGVVAVIGLDWLCLPLAVQYAARGWRVVVCNAQIHLVESINSGLVPHTEEPELENELPALVERGLLSATTSVSEAAACANVVVVLTSLRFDENHQVQFQDLDTTTEAIGRVLQPGTLVSYAMPFPVGTTAGRLRSCLEKYSGLDSNRNFYLAYSPEHAARGRVLRDVRTYPKFVGGVDARSTQVAAAFYRSVLPVEIMCASSATEAEFARLIEITYRDVNIALANEFACYADEHGLDVMAAIAAANSFPHSHVLRPGVGVGGSTLPVYPYLLLNDTSTETSAHEQGDFQHLRLPRAARRINDHMAEYAVQRIEAEAGSLWHRAVLLLGVTYREGVREIAYSSVYPLQDALWRRGATVYVDDPLYTPAELHAFGLQPLPPGRENEIDAIILQTAHQAYQLFDFRRFTRCRVLLDGRNRLVRARVQEAGIRYMALGNGVEDTVQCLVPFR